MIGLSLPRWLSPRLDVARQLAVYTTFHRSLGNRLLHGMLVPMVMFSMMCLQGYVGRPTLGAGTFVHLAAVLSVALGLILASVDLVGAIVLFVCFLLPASAVVGLIVVSLPWQWVVPSAIVMHAAAWYGTVVVGHERVEPRLASSTGPQDSNMYFRRGYYLARDLGPPVTRTDALVQFCIAPLSVVQDALAALGLRRDLEAAIRRERNRVIERLARGEPPLGDLPPRTIP